MLLEASWVYSTTYGWISGVGCEVTNRRANICTRHAIANVCDGRPWPMTAAEAAKAMAQIAARVIADHPDATFTRSANNRWPADAKFIDPPTLSAPLSVR